MNKTYRAIEPLLFNSTPIAIGESVELSDAAAKQLLELGHIELTDQAPELIDAEKADAIKQAMVGLDVDHAINWTKGGFPQTGVLSAAVGFEVKAGLRDALWAELKAAEAASLVKTEPAAAEVNDLSANATTETAA